MNRAEAFTLGAALGAGAMYLFDPDRGRRRRSLLRDRVVHAGHELDVAGRAGVRHVRNRAVGLAHEVKAELTEHDVDDRVLEERVRSEIGRNVGNPGAIEVRAVKGSVRLTGPVLTKEVQHLVRTVRSVRGVRHVDNRLQAEPEPGNIPDLQGTNN